MRLGGGPSHMDTFDLKPDAPDTHRGEFKPIATNVDGMQICEHLPKLAQCADKFAILRGVSHTLAAHELGTLYMGTGNRPLPSLDFPQLRLGGLKELGASRRSARRSSPSPTKAAIRPATSAWSMAPSKPAPPPTPARPWKSAASR